MKKTHVAWLIIIAAAILGGFIGMFLDNPPPAHAASSFAPIVCDNFQPIAISSGTTTKIITAGNANMFVYICSYGLSNGAAANNVALVEGTGSTCGTGTAGMAGGSTAGAGWNLPASVSINLGSGTGAVAKTATAGDNVCLITSSAGPLSGVISWTAAPY